MKVSGKLPPRKVHPRKLPTRKLLPMNISLWKLPSVKITLSPEIYPQQNFPLWKSLPLLFLEKITSHEIPSPLISYTNKRKNKITKLFALKKVVQYKILMKITRVLFDTQMISQKILGLDNFFTKWKKSRNWAKAKIAKWHLLASCRSQGELKLGSQTIKFGKYVKLLNSQLSLHITLWIFKKTNSLSAFIGSKCGYFLWVWMFLISTRINNAYLANMPDTDKSEGACCIFMSLYMLFCSNI